MAEVTITDSAEVMELAAARCHGAASAAATAAADERGAATSMEVILTLRLPPSAEQAAELQSIEVAEVTDAVEAEALRLPRR